MPLKIEAILSNTEDRNNYTGNTYKQVNPSDFWLVVSGVTPGSTLAAATRNLNTYGGPTVITIFELLYNYGVITAPQGYAIGSSSSKALVPLVFKHPVNTPQWLITNRAAVTGSTSYITTAGIVVYDINTNEQTVVSGPLSVSTVPSVWTISQDSSKNCNISCTSIGAGGKTPLLLSINRHTEKDFKVNQGIPGIFAVDVISPTGAIIFSSPVSFPGDGSLPNIQVPSASITTSGVYCVQIKSRQADPDRYDGNSIDNLYTYYKYQNYSTSLTAQSQSSASSSLFAWLNSDYWYLKDIQVNVGTREVTSRNGSIYLRPNDTVRFAVLFHNGTSGLNPSATDIKIAVRESSNNGPYVMWSSSTVTTVSVGTDTYYAITVTASDDDLLSRQAAQLLNESNTDQTLIGQIQWTTTRGTFSSNTFTITSKNEVVRDMDI